MHLVDIYNLLDCFILSDDKLEQCLLQGFGILARPCRVEHFAQPAHMCVPSFYSRAISGGAQCSGVSFHSTLSNPGATSATTLLPIAFIVKGTEFMKGYKSLFLN